MARAALVAALAAAVTLACGPSADATRSATVKCARARVAAVINHVSVCLTPGTKCNTTFLRQYERYSLYCWVGILARQIKAPLVTSVPTAPPNAPAPPPGTVDFTVKTAGDPSTIAAAPYPISACSSATVTDLSNNKNLGPGTRAEFSGVKEFTCADGGTIDIQYDVVWTVCTPANQGTWQIVGGTGGYATLSGQGQLVGTYFPGSCLDPSIPGGIYDRYTGTVGYG